MPRMTSERPRVNCHGPRAVREMQCRPTNTSARPATSASKRCSASPIRPLRSARTAAVSFGRSSRPSASFSREAASIRRTVAGPTSPQRRPRLRRVRRRHHRLNQVRHRPRLPRRPRRRRRRQLLQRTKSRRPRCCQSRRSDRRRRPAAIPGHCRRGRRRAASVATSTLQ